MSSASTFTFNPVTSDWSCLLAHIPDCESLLHNTISIPSQIISITQEVPKLSISRSARHGKQTMTFLYLPIYMRSTVFVIFPISSTHLHILMISVQSTSTMIWSFPSATIVKWCVFALRTHNGMGHSKFWIDGYVYCYNSKYWYQLDIGMSNYRRSS